MKKCPAFLQKKRYEHLLSVSNSKLYEKEFTTAFCLCIMYNLRCKWYKSMYTASYPVKYVYRTYCRYNYMPIEFSVCLPSRVSGVGGGGNCESTGGVGGGGGQIILSHKNPRGSLARGCCLYSCTQAKDTPLYVQYTSSPSQ